MDILCYQPTGSYFWKLLYSLGYLVIVMALCDKKNFIKSALTCIFLLKWLLPCKSLHNKYHPKHLWVMEPIARVPPCESPRPDDFKNVWSGDTGVCGGIYYEGIYMVKVILTEIYMLEHFLWSFFVTECHNYDQIAQGIQKFSKISSSWLITKDIHVLHGFFRRSEWKLLKESVGKRSPI